MIPDAGVESLRLRFRDALGADPVGAYREWFRAQEELRADSEDRAARALADDLWGLLPGLPFQAAEERARFQHNAGVFYGSPGPAASLERARELFEHALLHFAKDPETGWHARCHHNFATALSNLGTSEGELRESVSLFERALAWRTAEREIARGVTLHNLGLALRRLAELDPADAARRLDASAAVLREAVAIRDRHGLAEGRAASEKQLSITLARLSSAAGPSRPAGERDRFRA